jgi:hypothetical protein
MLTELFPRFAMAFASAPAAIDGGAGGAEPSGGSSPEPPPAEPAVIEPEPAQEPSGGELPAREPAEPQDREPREAQPKPGDGRTLPKEMQAAIKMLRENPATAQAARTLADEHFQLGRVVGEKGIYKNFDEARTVRSHYDAVGGADGIADLQSRSQALDDIDERVDRGDPSVIKDMAENAPGGFKLLVPEAVETLRKMDSEAFDSLMRPHFVQALEAAGLGEEILQTIEELRAGQNEVAQRRLANLQRWFAAQRDAVERQKSVKPDPRLADLDRRDKEVRQKEEASFRKNLSYDTMNYINSSLGEELENLWKGYDLKDNQKQYLAQRVYDEVEKMFKEDKSYQSQNNANIRSRNHARALTYIKSQVDVALPRAARTVWDTLYGNIQPPRAQRPKPAAPAATDGQPAQRNGNGQPQAPAATRPILLAQKPSWDQLDMSKDPNQILYITGKGYLKTGPNAGKLVTWKK